MRSWESAHVAIAIIIAECERYRVAGTQYQRVSRPRRGGEDSLTLIQMELVCPGVVGNDDVKQSVAVDVGEGNGNRVSPVLRDRAARRFSECVVLVVDVELLEAAVADERINKAVVIDLRARPRKSGKAGWARVCCAPRDCAEFSRLCARTSPHTTDLVTVAVCVSVVPVTAEKVPPTL